MRLMYLCKVDPPPPMSDFDSVQNFLEMLPNYLQPKSSNNNSKQSLYYADRIGDKLVTDFHDFAIAFVSGRFLADDKAMQCLAYVSKSFPNMVCIDLYNNLTPEQKENLKQYTVNIYSIEEGKNFLVNTFTDEDAISKQEAEALEKSIETDGYDYLETTITSLNDSARSNKLMACLCYLGALVFIVGGMFYYFSQNGLWFKGAEKIELYALVYETIKLAFFSGLLISITRLLFLLGKSFMVEAIRFSDRAHAIRLGKLYLQLYKSKFEWGELKDVLQNWNIDKGSAFINLDAKDIENVGVEKIITALRNK